MATNKDWKGWRRQTLAVRGGQLRSPFQETSEALYLTAGYAYEGPEEAEERFKGAPGYTYTRYNNPTISIFEDRMALLEGAPVGRSTASGMAAVPVVATATVKGTNVPCCALRNTFCQPSVSSGRTLMEKSSKL